MSQTTTQKKGDTSKTEDLVSNLTEAAEGVLGEKGTERVKELGTEQLRKLRELIADRPLQAIGAGIAIGVLLRSLFRGPTTLLLVAGAAYLGSQYASRTR